MSPRPRRRRLLRTRHSLSPATDGEDIAFRPPPHRLVNPDGPQPDAVATSDERQIGMPFIIRIWYTCVMPLNFDLFQRLPVVHVQPLFFSLCFYLFVHLKVLVMICSCLQLPLVERSRLFILTKETMLVCKCINLLIQDQRESLVMNGRISHAFAALVLN
jgi:hypothetical protein